MVLLDGFPVTVGHTLVVPRQYVARNCELSAEEQPHRLCNQTHRRSCSWQSLGDAAVGLLGAGGSNSTCILCGVSNHHCLLTSATVYDL